MSGLLLGKMMGNHASVLGDAYVARKIPIFTGYTLMILGPVSMATLCYSRWPMLASCLLMGLGAGMTPAMWAYLSEMTPTKWRGILNAIAMVLYDAGALFVILLAWFYSPSLQFG